MRTNNLGRALLYGLTGSTVFLIACGAGVDSRRHDALWTEYRSMERAADARRDDATLFAEAEHLDRAALVEAVLTRNPDVAAARAGLRAALAEIDLATALDDPTISYEVAPLSVAGDAPFGQRVEIRQMLPFPGKRRLAGEAALAMAEAEAAEIEVVQLELAQMASEMFDDYYVVARALAINEHHRALMAEMKESAEIQYVAGHASQQDPIKAEVELAELEIERLGLEAERDQITARLNGLLHREPGAPLPPPPAELDVAQAPAGTSAELQELALEQRPQRDATRARIRAAQAEVAVARRDYYPDFELMAGYDSMWDMPEHQWMVGVMIEVPLQRGKRRAAVEQAEAETAAMRFEDESLIDTIRVEVDRGHSRVVEAKAIVELNEQKLLPAVRDQLDAARAGFASAQNDFMAVVEAEETLRAAELELEMARAELSRRQAALARAVGLVPGLPEGGAR
ncbi:MAG: TolC family protein [Kofleriaceae bacterium]|jgi:cobalt-zinc-cadmium efflux system outer membrane protein|nr:TolC family protein [Kofleriaceae bacterium]